jgi:dTDP-4-amino-4,6-dideoxygalactose transaminase
MIPHNRPTIGHEEILASNRVLNSGWIAQGEEVAALEAEIGAFINLPAENVVAVSS